jgi:F-type H+-transporting ATPase subunit delta
VTSDETTTQHASVMDSETVALGRVYAQALVDSFPAEAPARAFGEELAALAEAIRQTPGCEEFLANPTLGAAKRADMVRRVFGSRVSEIMLSLLSVLARNHRLAVIPAVAEQFDILLDARNRRVDVSVRAPFSLSEAQRDGLRRSLAESLRAEPRLHVTVDPDLIGGLVVRVGDTIYDASVAGALAKWQETAGQHSGGPSGNPMRQP